jgi:heme/copper-type cytochrome/quinol oxidase subunit 3
MRGNLVIWETFVLLLAAAFAAVAIVQLWRRSAAEAGAAAGIAIALAVLGLAVILIEG